MRVIEIFHSIQGESTLSGFPTTFVRFAVCNLRCAWCDTTYSFGPGIEMSRQEIHQAIDEAGLKRVCLTGGEPLLQKELPTLCGELLIRNVETSVETGGHMDISVLPSGIRRICDLKAPGAFGRIAKPGRTRAEILKQTRFYSGNLEPFTSMDEVKIVISSIDELPWVRSVFDVLELQDKVGAVHLSPVHGTVDLETLANWMVRENIPARLHLQLHKIVFGVDATGV